MPVAFSDTLIQGQRRTPKKCLKGTKMKTITDVHVPALNLTGSTGLKVRPDYLNNITTRPDNLTGKYLSVNTDRHGFYTNTSKDLYET